LIFNVLNTKQLYSSRSGRIRTISCKCI